MDGKVWGSEDERLHNVMCSVLSEPKRVQLLYLLAAGERAVGELVALTGFHQPTISRHLQMLRKYDLVQTERRGNFIYYSLGDRRVIEALQLLAAVFARPSGAGQ